MAEHVGISIGVGDNLPEVLDAIAVVRRHLADGWISDGCRHPDTQEWGCVSCQAAMLDQNLRLLEDSIKADMGDAPSPSQTPSQHSDKE